MLSVNMQNIIKPFPWSFSGVVRWHAGITLVTLRFPKLSALFTVPDRLEWGERRGTSTPSRLHYKCDWQAYIGWKSLPLHPNLQSQYKLWEHHLLRRTGRGKQTNEGVFFCMIFLQISPLCASSLCLSFFQHCSRLPPLNTSFPFSINMEVKHLLWSHSTIKERILLIKTEL